MHIGLKLKIKWEWFCVFVYKKNLDNNSEKKKIVSQKKNKEKWKIRKQGRKELQQGKAKSKKIVKKIEIGNVTKQPRRK